MSTKNHRIRDLIAQADRASKSITHKHILSIINTRLRSLPTKEPVRILDAGCGNCDLIAFLETFTSRFHGGLQVEIHGFDVCDSRVQFQGFHDAALGRLKKQHANIDWRQRIHTIRQEDPWPFDDETFDIVVSNQVMEHVRHHESFMAQNWRVLKDKGFSIHLFPVKNYIVEGHLHLPFVHRIRQWHALYWYIKFLSFLRIGKWKNLTGKCSLHNFSESYADFLTYYCNYVSISDLLEFGKKCGFRTGFNYTGRFYYEKLKEILRIKHEFFYKRERFHLFSIHLFKFIQCITLFLEKKDSYVNYIAKHCSDGEE